MKQPIERQQTQQKNTPIAQTSRKSGSPFSPNSFVDNRQEARDQMQMKQMIQNSPRSLQMKNWQDMANKSQQIQQKKDFQTNNATPISSQKKPIQRSVYVNDVYGLGKVDDNGIKKNISSQFNLLNFAGMLAADSAKTIAEDDSKDKSKHQLNYAKRGDAKSWGYCVEEQLNSDAEDLGWETQKVLKGARPDYFQIIDGWDVYADLTTDEQSMDAGVHVGEKLTKAKKSPVSNIGADITYPSLKPKPKLSESDKAKLAIRRRQKNYDALFGDEYLPEKDKKSKYKKFMRSRGKKSTFDPY